MKLIDKTEHGRKNWNETYRTSVFDVLLHELVCSTKCYRTDILVEYSFCERKMKEGKDFTRYVGFRENGVDHEEFMHRREFVDYSAVYKYAVTFDGDEYTTELWILDEADYNELFKKGE